MRSLLFLSLVALGLVGCGNAPQYPQYITYAYKANTTYDTKEQNSLECEIEAAQKVSVETKNIVRPFRQSYKCRTRYSWNTTNTTCTVSKAYGGDTITIDANRGLRLEAQMLCMRKKGYRLIEMELCRKNEIPKELPASLDDLIIRPEGEACAVEITKHVSIPIKRE